MTVGDPQAIYLKDPPCLRGIDTRIRDGRLHFFVYFRSWDLWNGFPANLAAIQLLKEYMAQEIGVAGRPDHRRQQRAASLRLCLGIG